MIRLPAEYTPGNWGILADSFSPQEAGSLAYFDGQSVNDNPYPAGDGLRGGRQGI